MNETKRLREVVEETTSADLPAISVKRVKRCEVLGLYIHFKHFALW